MSKDLVKRLRDKNCCDATKCNCDEAADRIEQLETALRQCHDVLEVAFDYNDGDVFGIHHNDAVDAVMTAKNILGVK